MIPVCPLQLRIFCDPVILSRVHVLLNLGRWRLQGEKDHRIVRKSFRESWAQALSLFTGSGVLSLSWFGFSQPQLAMSSVPFLDKAAQDLDHSYPTVL